MTDGISLIRRRAASTTIQKSSTPVSPTSTLPKRSMSESTHKKHTAEEEPFIIVSQEEFAEHASAITHAKFSSQGELIASCDMDNIVR